MELIPVEHATTYDISGTLYTSIVNSPIYNQCKSLRGVKFRLLSASRNKRKKALKKPIRKQPQARRKFAIKTDKLKEEKTRRGNWKKETKKRVKSGKKKEMKEKSPS